MAEHAFRRLRPCGAPLAEQTSMTFCVRRDLNSRSTKNSMRQPSGACSEGPVLLGSADVASASGHMRSSSAGQPPRGQALTELNPVDQDDTRGRRHGILRIYYPIIGIQQRNIGLPFLDTRTNVTRAGIRDRARYRRPARPAAPACRKAHAVRHGSASQQDQPDRGDFTMRDGAQPPENPRPRRQRMRFNGRAEASRKPLAERRTFVAANSSASRSGRPHDVFSISCRMLPIIRRSTSAARG